MEGLDLFFNALEGELFTFFLILEINNNYYITLYFLSAKWIIHFKSMDCAPKQD